MPTSFAAAGWPQTIDFENGTTGFAAIANKSTGNTNWGVVADPDGSDNKVLYEGKKDGAMSDLRMHMVRTGKAFSFEFDTYRANTGGISYIRLFEGSTGGCSGDANPFLIKLYAGIVRNNNDKNLASFSANTWYTFKLEVSADLTQERIYMKKRDAGSYEYIGSCVLASVDLSKTADLFYYKYEYEANAYIDNIKFRTLDKDVVAGFTAGKDGENFDIHGNESITAGNFYSGYSAVRAQSDTYTASTQTGLFGKKANDAALTASATTTYIQNRNSYLGLKEGDKIHIGASVAFDENASTYNDYYDFQFLRCIKDTYVIAGTANANVRINGADVLFLRADGTVQFSGGYATVTNPAKVSIIKNHWYRADFVIKVGKTGTADTGVMNHIDIYLDGVQIGGYDFNGWQKGIKSMTSNIEKTTDEIYAIEGFNAGDLRFRTNTNGIYWDDFVFDKTDYKGTTFTTSLNTFEFKAPYVEKISNKTSVEAFVNSVSGADDVAVLDSSFNEKTTGTVVAGDIVRVEADDTTYFYTVKDIETSILSVSMDKLTNSNTIDGKLQFAKAGKTAGPYDAVKATSYTDASTADTSTVINDYMFNDAEISDSVGNRADNVLKFHMKRPDAGYTYITLGAKEADGAYSSISAISSDPLYDPFTNIQNVGNKPYSTTKPITFEGMFYQSSNKSSMYLAPNNAWTSYGIGIFQNGTYIRALGDNVVPYRANTWYNWALTYIPKGDNVYEVKAYVNGVLVNDKDFTIASGLYRLKAGFSSPNVAYDIIGAMDNQAIYLGEYEPEGKAIDCESTTVDVTLADYSLTASAVMTVADVEAALDTNADNVEIYADNTYASKLASTDTIATGNVVVLTLGDIYKYYDVTAPSPAEYQYTLADSGIINKDKVRAGMFYTVNVNKVSDELTLAVDGTEFTITGLGKFDVNTSLTYALIGSGALGDIPTNITVKSGENVYEAQ